MNEQRLDDRLGPTYSSSVPIRDVAWKTCQKRWTVEMNGERGSGKSSQVARHREIEKRKSPTNEKNYKIFIQYKTELGIPLVKIIKYITLIQIIILLSYTHMY